MLYAEATGSGQCAFSGVVDIFGVVVMTDSSDQAVDGAPHRPFQEEDEINAARGYQTRLGVALAQTLLVLVAEVIGSVVTGSLALLVDSGHMLTDVAVLAASTVTAFLRRRKPDKRLTWGYARLEVITAGLGAFVLMVVGIYAFIEAMMRLFGFSQSEAHSDGLLFGFGLLGLFSNLVSAVLLSRGKNDNLNMKAAFLETVNDTLGSLAVVASAVVMMTTGWGRFDALAGAVIAVMMIPRAFVLMRDALKVLLEETPEDLDLDEVRRHIEKVDHVVSVHDLHASTVATGTPTLSAHVVVEKGLSESQDAEILRSLHTCLVEHFPVSVSHTTFQLEPEGYSRSTKEYAHR
ncbi:cobalt-zinc-cadmium resistance protein [Bifidobacterium bombi DSM 19703]|uniref:Cobalt-zinc-cadmium resistance protein n=2 Tax=Bifidobacterium bombi TaxID=471511 RepID=A0A080N317_9BIFI|nr:cobalt-zinc-cadmium resistance protein [Bifidobacterium bombi DSM 19703]